MNPFTRHPTDQGVTYWEHFGFAIGIARRLLASVLSFALHGLVPFVSIEPKNDLEATAAFLLERNQWIESAASAGTEDHYQDSQHDNPLPA